MLEINRSYEYKPIQLEKMKEVQQEVFEGLSLGEAAFLRIPRHIEEDITGTIAKNLLLSTQNLKISLPQVGLTVGWGGELLMEESEHYDPIDITANAFVGPSIEDGIVRFSPRYLMSLMSRKMGIPQNQDIRLYSLEEVTAHETFHLYQYKNQPEQVIEDVQILNKEGIEAWNRTKSEIEAREYQLSWLHRNHVIQNIPSFIQKNS